MLKKMRDGKGLCLELVSLGQTSCFVFGLCHGECYYLIEILEGCVAFDTIRIVSQRTGKSFECAIGQEDIIFDDTLKMHRDDLKACKEDGEWALKLYLDRLRIVNSKKEVRDDGL